MPYINNVRNQETYMELEERFLSLLTYNPDAICTISRDGIFESVNPATEEMTGYSPEEINNTLLKEIIGKKDLNKIRFHFKRTLKGSSQNYYLDFKHKNGRIINLFVKNVPIEVNHKIVGIYLIARDITEQKNIERELKDSESKYRLITENMSDLICVLDHNGTVEYASPSHKSMTGYSAEEYIGVTPFQFIHPEDVMDIQNRFNDIMTNKQHFQVEHRYKHVNGDWIVVEANVKPVLDHNGDVKNVVIVARDITQRKKTEDELQESEKRLRALINVLPDGVFFKDGEGRWLEVNCTALDLFELGGVPYRGKTDAELAEYTPRKDDLLSCYQTDEQAWAASEMIRVEEVVRKSDGNSLFFDTVKVPIFHSDGKRKGMVVIGRDITGRKQIEEALIEAESKYRNLVERALVGVYIYQENTYEYVNPRYAEIFGYTVDELLKLSPLDLLQNGEKKQWIENFHQRISGDNNSLHYQIQGLKKDGTLIECEVHGTVTMYKGKPAIVGTLLDITERKKTEEILRKTDKLSIVSELAAGIAHEIRNPLTSLKGFVQLLKEESGTNNFYYEIMLSELERINSIVSEFLILSKPQFTNYEMKGLIQILTSVVTLLESEAHKNNVQILTAFHLDNVQINCVESQLKQVFINVLKNAMEAMPSGGNISVHAELDQDGYVRIKFVDQGCGIPVSRISKLGEPFYTTKEKGTGLGLMVSYKIIENHFGKIKIKSKENKGTTVEIQLPVGLIRRLHRE